MSTMFSNCQELETLLDLSNFTNKVINMKYMSNKCYKLKEIKGIYNFRISDMASSLEMFDECNDLEYIDRSKFNALNSQLIYKIINRKLIKGN